MNVFVARIIVVNDIAEQLLKVNFLGKDSIVNIQKQFNYRQGWGRQNQGLREQVVGTMEIGREFCRVWDRG